MTSEVVIGKKEYVIITKKEYELLKKGAVLKSFEGRLFSSEQARKKSDSLIEKWAKLK